MIRLNKEELATIKKYGEKEARRWVSAKSYIFKIGERYNIDNGLEKTSINNVDKKNGDPKTPIS